MTEKIVAIVFLLAAAIFGLIAYDPFDLQNFDLRNGLTRRHGFSDLISEDLMMMRKKNLLPKAWSSIQYTAYNFHSDLQRKLVGEKKIEIKETPQGLYRLEIEFIDVPDETEPSVILQMSMFEIASNNKVWELGRTYSIVPFLKKEGSDPTKSEKKEAATPKGRTTERDSKSSASEGAAGAK